MKKKNRVWVVTTRSEGVKSAPNSNSITEMSQWALNNEVQTWNQNTEASVILQLVQLISWFWIIFNKHQVSVTPLPASPT